MGKSRPGCRKKRAYRIPPPWTTWPTQIPIHGHPIPWLRSHRTTSAQNHPIDPILVCPTAATEHRRNEVGACGGLRLPPGDMMNHRIPPNVPALFPDSQTLSQTLSPSLALVPPPLPHTPHPLGRSMDGLGATPWCESRASSPRKLERLHNVIKSSLRFNSPYQRYTALISRTTYLEALAIVFRYPPPAPLLLLSEKPT
ncbi:hypothetical protein CORC01_01266 [Colletotrichum orchidophilum]|uniref:Uncharacterized protein n=1 Tax=Colletotrichum orchidophilum TaxID=1209926 RepID=A0A1G4BQI8_9PEZI|nr:uncharacterized protein CORC01_01266 [Colletotrichum orchidophilum]OHF03547.1 hypothetical protein CORC01_01266 [Colletotrichum orchidophilum]